jgi:hypothetical protein
MDIKSFLSVSQYVSSQKVLDGFRLDLVTRSTLKVVGGISFGSYRFNTIPTLHESQIEVRRLSKIDSLY